MFDGSNSPIFRLEMVKLSFMNTCLFLMVMFNSVITPALDSSGPGRATRPLSTDELTPSKYIYY
jgi:hypothetical protein